ncbi:Protein IQ-DOMAIN 33 [Linum grandiflorum]
MGMINGRNVFSRTRSASSSSSATSRRGNGRSNDKKRWSVVRSYLCGDEEFDSVLAEEDSASVKSSEAMVSSDQPYASNGEIFSEQTVLSRQEEDAAIIIQTAFRRLMARRQDGDAKIEDGQLEVQDIESGSPGKYSVSTSIEVQTGNSIDCLSITEENSGAQCNNKIQKKTRTQVSRSKEDWDDSTLSSNVLRMRIQSRLEATNRRERALAYAFSQQLRICSRNKQERPDCTQPNKSWHWLERWMATRVPDFSLESYSSKQIEEKANNSNREAVAKGRCFDLAVEEKESCGSNDVPVPAESLPVQNAAGGIIGSSFRKKTKPGINISRRKTVPSHQCPKEPKVRQSIRIILHQTTGRIGSYNDQTAIEKSSA